MAYAIKKAGIGRLVIQVVHGLVEGDMLSRLNCFGDSVIVQDILHGLREPQKYPDTCIGDNLGRTARARGQSINSTPKYTKIAKIGLLTGTHLERGSRLVTMHSNVVEAKKVMKSIGPELRRKSSTAKHGANGVTNGLMGTFARTILVGGVRSSRFDRISSLLE
jgi:hypothetical protein